MHVLEKGRVVLGVVTAFCGGSGIVRPRTDVEVGTGVVGLPLGVPERGRVEAPTVAGHDEGVVCGLVGHNAVVGIGDGLVYSRMRHHPAARPARDAIEVFRGHIAGFERAHYAGGARFAHWAAADFRGRGSDNVERGVEFWGLSVGAYFGREERLVVGEAVAVDGEEIVGGWIGSLDAGMIEFKLGPDLSDGCGAFGGT